MQEANRLKKRRSDPDHPRLRQNRQDGAPELPVKRAWEVGRVGKGRLPSRSTLVFVC